MARSNDPVHVLVVTLSPGEQADASRPAAAVGLQRADERFTVKVESVSDADEALTLCEHTGTDCVVVAGADGGPSLDLLAAIGERRPELPRIYVAERPVDIDTRRDDSSNDALREGGSADDDSADDDPADNDSADNDSAGDDPIAAALAAGATDVVDARRDGDVTRLLARRIGNAVDAARAVAESDRHRQRLDRFVSGVSHDLRNPLNVAQGRLDLARETGDPEHLDTAATAVDRTLELIEDLLTLAKQGERPDELEPVALREVAETSWSHVDTGDAVLSVETDQRILAHSSRLKQLLENLFGNAVTHGGEEVTVVVGELSPMYTTTRGGGARRSGFYVADDGPGIPDEECEDVFEIGYTTGDDGTGFGLNIVQEVAAAHGWNVTLTRGVRGGARFEIAGVDVID